LRQIRTGFRQGRALIHEGFLEMTEVATVVAAAATGIK
jgi:hypothetical protein